ncbi:MAG: acyl carrier protein [Ferruginibacter sp.]
MEQEIIISDIKKYIEQNILSEDVVIDSGTGLSDAGVDSFSIVEIILFIERKYGVAIPDDQLIPDNFRTLQTLSSTVMALIRK